MPVSVACSCGKKLRVPDEYVGKKVKCPGCGTAILVKAPEEEPAEEPAPAPAQLRKGTPPKKAPPPPPDEEEPEEEERPRARRRNERDEEDEDEPRSKKRAREEEPDDEPEDDEDEPREKRKKKKGKKKAASSGMPLVLIFASLGGVLLVGGVGAAIWWFVGGGQVPGPSETAFVTPDAQGFVTMKVADLARNPETQKAIQQLGPNGPGQFTDPVGLSVNDIDRATFVVQDGNQTPPLAWVVITTTTPYDQSKTLGRLINARKVTHEGRTFHVGQTTGGGGAPAAPPMPPAMPGQPGRPMQPGMPGQPGMGAAPGAPSELAVYFSDKNLMVTAPSENAMKQALTLATRKNVTGPLSASVGQVGGAHQVFGVLTLTPQQQQQAKTAGTQLPAVARSAAPIFELTGGTVAMDFGTNVLIELNLKYADDKKASAARSAVGTLTTLAQGLLFVQTGPEAKLMRELLGKIKSEARGSEMNVKMDVPASLLQGMNNPAGGPAGGPAGMPGRPGGVPGRPGGMPKR